MTIVFKYGAIHPNLNNEIRIQMKLARDYYNKLVEAENNRRKIFWGGENPPKPPHDHTNGDSKKCEECKAFWKSFREIYKQLQPLDLKPLRKIACDNGLYWGSYLIVEEAFSAAWKKTDCFSTVKFRSWKQGGYAGVQIQREKSPETLYKIEKAYDPRVGRRAGQRHTIQLRIGTDGREPILSKPISFEMHRPLQGRPVWAKICMKYRGQREIWTVNITCADTTPRADLSDKGFVAIDVGWRKMDDESIRLAYATGSDGEESEFRMPMEWLERSRRADRIRSHRDERLNKLKEVNPKYNKVKKPQGVIGYATKHELLNDDIIEWNKQDRHLSDYEIGCRRRSVEGRREALRVWLRKLRRKYKVAIIKDSSHKEMKDHKKAVDSGMYSPQRRNAHHVAPGEIIEEICRVFGRMENVAVVDAQNTTAACLKCGHVNIVGSEKMIVCEQCSAYEDRDRVSTRNLINLYNLGEYKKPTTRKTTARFAKRHKNFSKPRQCQHNGL